MARAKINVKMDQNVTANMKKLKLSFRSPEVTRELQRGAEIMASAARQKAPVRTGALRQGVYTASMLKDNRPSIKRSRGSGEQEVVKQLRFPPRKGQVVLTSGTFYGVWVEKGRKKAAVGSGDGLKVRSVGRMRRRPFFMPGVRAARASAESYIVRRVSRLIEESQK